MPSARVTHERLDRRYPRGPSARSSHGAGRSSPFGNYESLAPLHFLDDFVGRSFHCRGLSSRAYRNLRSQLVPQRYSVACVRPVARPCASFHTGRHQRRPRSHQPLSATAAGRTASRACRSAPRPVSRLNPQESRFLARSSGGHRPAFPSRPCGFGFQRPSRARCRRGNRFDRQQPDEITAGSCEALKSNS